MMLDKIVKLSFISSKIELFAFKIFLLDQSETKGNIGFPDPLVEGVIHHFS